MTTKLRSCLIKYVFGLCVSIVLLGCAKPAEKVLSRCHSLMKDGKYLEAANLLKELTVLYPNNPQAWNQLGVAYHNYGDLIAATHAYTMALKLSNSFSIAHYNLGCALFEMRNYLQASREFASYVMYEPQSVDGWVKLGSTQLYLGQYNEAEKSFRAALSLNPQSYEAYNGLGISAVYLKKWREASQHFSNALRIKPDYAPANLNMAVVLLNYHKDKENAAKMFRRFMQIKPQSPYNGTIMNLLSKLEASPAPIITNRTETIQTNIIKPQVRTEEKTDSVRSAETVRLHQQQPLTTEKQPPATNHVVKESAKPVISNESTIKTPVVVSAPKIQTNQEKVITSDVKPQVVPTTQQIATQQIATKVQKETQIVITPTETSASEVTVKPPDVSTNKVSAKSEDVKIVDLGTAEQKTKSAETSETKKEKPGFAKNLLDKINPFKKKTTPKPIITPLPSDSNVREPASAQDIKTEEKRVADVKKAEPVKPLQTTKEVAMVETKKSESKPLIETKPQFPRYKYKNPPKPQEGNVEEAQKHFKLGLECHEAGNLVEAKIHYAEAIRLNPAFYEATYNLALICFKHNEIERALELYEKALAINPDAQNARLNFAIALQKGNYIIDAVNEFEKYLKLNPDDARVHLLVANLYAQQLKDKTNAANHYKEVLRIEPSHPQALVIHQWLKQNMEQ